jgi:hypothetical protein
LFRCFEDGGRVGALVHDRVRRQRHEAARDRPDVQVVDLSNIRNRFEGARRSPSRCARVSPPLIHRRTPDERPEEEMIGR